MPLKTPSALLHLALALVGSALSLALAQQLSVRPLESTLGEAVAITGSGLPPRGQVTVRLTAPTGAVTREGARVAENGRFRLEFTPDAAGDYLLVVRGEGLDETRALRVRPAAARTAPGTVSPTPLEGPEPTAQAPATAPETEADDAVAAPAVTRTANGLEARQNGALSWRLTFPEGSGATTAPLFKSEELYVGHGNSVLRLDPHTGAVRERWPVSGPVARLEANQDTVAITVRHGEGLLERLTLRGGTLQETVRFGLDPATFGLLRAEAQVPNPAARLARDPTNPWLHLAHGLRQTDPDAARAAFSEAVATARTFYDHAGLATALFAAGETALAAGAFDAAMQDFAARGYDPRLLRDARLEAAYNFPLTPLREALSRRDDLGAGFWAERLWLVSANVPSAPAALADYAALLRSVAAPDTAALWEGRAAAMRPAGATALDRAATTLARSGWAAALALLGAFFALQLTLLSKYARARRADRAEGGRVPWLFAVRYTTLTEKLVLLLLLAAALACGALGSWYGSLRAVPQLVGSGTFQNRAAQVALAEAELSGPRGAFVRSYAAQRAGDLATAQPLLERAGRTAPALNNLAVLTGDATLYEQALGLEPTLSAARYNLGETALLPFHARYLPGEPALAVPTPQDVRGATTGTWQRALAGAFTAPQGSLQDAAPFRSGLGATVDLVLWRAAQLLFALLALVTVVFLFVPRPRSSRHAPRPWSYEVLALLIPGSGLADEAWGVLLLVPWAVFGLAALAGPLGWTVDLGLTPLTLYVILGGIYLLNAVAVAVEWLSHRAHRRAYGRRGAAGKA